MRTLSLRRPQMTGSDVKYCQKLLIKHGYLPAPVTGVFDEKTAVAVRWFRMANMMGTKAEMDSDLWSLLIRPKLTSPDLHIDSRNAAVAIRSTEYLGIPYIYGSSDPSMGLDSLGFLLNVLTKVGLISQPWPNVTLATFLEQFRPTDIPLPGDLVFYTGQSGLYPTHVLIILNDQFGVGPLGGNANTTTRKLALQRGAEVKMVNYNYKKPAGFLALSSLFECTHGSKDTSHIIAP